LGADPAVLVLYTNKPAAGEVTGLAALVAVSAIRGGKKPWLVEATSNFADGLGVEVPIPVWAFPLRNTKNNAIITIPLFMLI
jgi:hypothetical protein